MKNALKILVHLFFLTSIAVGAAHAQTSGTNSPNWATTAQAQAGTDTTHSMNPARGLDEIKAFPGAAKAATTQNGTATASTTGVMLGLGSQALITPVKSGKVLVTICGFIQNGSTGDGSQWQMSYGTGTAPTTNAAATGTFISGVNSYLNPNTGTAIIAIPFCVVNVVTGLTLGTQYWFDLMERSYNGGGTTTTAQLSFSAVEL